MKIKIGIIFGGKSREREISFAGGRTVYDNLNKSLFEPVPLFADPFGNFILLEWKFVYKGSIRDFYPCATDYPDSEKDFQLYADSLTHKSPQQLAQKIGQIIPYDQLKQHIDFAFLALHGTGGEDGSIQGLLQYIGIPYTASGILPSAIGMNKAFQKKMMQGAHFQLPNYQIIDRKEWLQADTEKRKIIFEQLYRQIGTPMVIKAANQGSSIGVSKITEQNFSQFEKAIDNSFFITHITRQEWISANKEQRKEKIAQLADFRTGIGLPLHLTYIDEQNTQQISSKDAILQSDNSQIVHLPSQLLNILNNLWLDSPNDISQNPTELVDQPNHHINTVQLAALDTENQVVVESFLHGKEFSCIVIKTDDGKTVALPPTEIRKGQEIFDYRAKYLPGLSSKQTPINLPNYEIQKIRTECERLFDFFDFHTYARIDGFIDQNKNVYLNDPNTTSGMLPSSFFFHQAAEIGLNPSQFLTYIIRNSILQRVQHNTDGYQYQAVLEQLDKNIAQQKNSPIKKQKIGVILGGYSSERHISVESGRNIYEKLASSDKYEPIPIFLTGDEQSYQLYQIPINILLKDNADDIAEKIKHYKEHPVTAQIKKQCAALTQQYTNNQVLIQQPQLIHLRELRQMVDAVFIALHGRPGEDGDLQKQLQKYQIPYNGSDSDIAEITIDKYVTNQLLKRYGFNIAEQTLVTHQEWQNNHQRLIKNIEKTYRYPFIVKPTDDGCSSAVKKINNRSELIAYAQLIFRDQQELLKEPAQLLRLQPKEEFPIKKTFLIETLIEKGDATHFLEITGGMLTHRCHDYSWEYEMFQPSETLANQEILSLEEKFLAGQGQNITPPRYDQDPERQKQIAKIVVEELKRTAEVIGIEGYARIDAFVKIYPEKVLTYIIEINSLPGMTPATCIFHQCALNGYTPYQFIDAIITYAIKKQNEQPN